MNCELCRESLMDVLYGEELNPRFCFEFFRHVDGCTSCHDEYMELLDTRDMLGQWEVDGPSSDLAAEVRGPNRIVRLTRGVRRNWWPVLQKIAAAFLIVAGAASILQGMGYLGGRKLMVSEQSLSQMVQDMIVLEQVRERRVLGQALVNFADEITLQQSSDRQGLSDEINRLEQRYLDNLEQNNQYLKTLLSRGSD